jgi:hypothetical protein
VKSPEVHGCRAFYTSRLVLEGNRPVEVENKILECVYIGGVSDNLTAEVRTEDYQVQAFY